MTDIDAIRQREQAATPGPWEVFGATKDDDGRDALIVCHTAGDRTDPAPLAEVPFNVGDEPGDVGADAEFIAHARTDIPALLAELDAARAVVEAAKAWAKFEGLTEQNNLTAAVDALNAAQERANCADCRAEQAGAS